MITLKPGSEHSSTPPSLNLSLLLRRRIFPQSRKLGDGQSPSATPDHRRLLQDPFVPMSTESMTN